jgi:hypothetical protein
LIIPKQIAFIELSIGAWSQEIDESLLPQLDKDLINEHGRVVTFYAEDYQSGKPDFFKVDNTLINWATYAKDFANEDHLGVKLGMRAILYSAIGETEQLRFNTFNRTEQEQLINYMSIVEDSTGINYYSQEEGYDVAMATECYTHVKMCSMENTAKACKARWDNKAMGWYPIIFKYFSQSTAFVINGEIDSDSTKLKNNYVEFGTFGTQWGDLLIIGLLDYFYGNVLLPENLSDHPLINELTFEEARDELIEYFYTRWRFT